MRYVTFSVLLVASTWVVGCGGGGDAGDTGRVSGSVTADICSDVDAPAEACEPQSVVGAPIELRHATDPSVEPRRTITDNDGEYRIDVEPGEWIVSAGPIPALDGTPPEVPVTVTEGSETEVSLVYTAGGQGSGDAGS